MARKSEEVRHLGEKKRPATATVEKEKDTYERDYSRYAFSYPTDQYKYALKPGLSREVVAEISAIKNEPAWMREFRLAAYEVFVKKPLPTWGGDLSKISFDAITYYATPTDKGARSWDDVPEEVKKTFDRLGIPEAERKFLAGVGAQYDSEVVYHSIREDLAKKGVIFLSMDDGLREYPDLVKEYIGTVIPPTDNKFAALNSATWSGGSFIYVPKGVQVEIPLQAYFRINAPQMGQFERTLIIADEGARVHYIEGCLPGGEQVSMGDRWVNIESLKPGDYVVADNGQKARVRATMVRPYRGEMLTIRPISPYNAFRLTPEHPVLVVRRANVLTKRRARNGWLPEVDTKELMTAQPEYIPAGELHAGDFLVFPKVKSESPNSKYTPELLKLMGYYLAEGSAFVNKALNRPVVSFSFGAHEDDIVAEVCMLIEQTTGKQPCITKIPAKHAVNVTVYSRELMSICTKTCGKGATAKRLSPELMALPPEQIEPLLEGYFRGDGNVCDKGNSVMYRASTASETLAQQLQELLARKGIYASIQVCPGGDDVLQGCLIHRQNQYIVGYTTDKRWSEIRATEKYFLVPIKSIERAPYDGFVFNLDVEGPNSYLVRGFAVHNCTAPVYSRESLHSAVVELIAKRGAHLRYTTLQNWSNDVYNLVTKRAVAYEDATVEWVDANIGSRITMKYPSVYMLGKGARADILSVAFAGKGQHQDTGGKAIHAAPYTTSTIVSKSVSKDGGRASYRGQLVVAKGAHHAKSNVRCDALLLDDRSRSDTYPYIEIDEDQATIGHEATVGKVGDDQIFYLQSRGLSESEALSMIVLGFMEPFTKTLPMEYAIEFNRLIQLEMEGSVG
jgi:Fe-S cluster assembly protein SufB